MTNGEGQHFFGFKSFFGVLRGTRALSSHLNLSHNLADWLDFLSFFFFAFALCLLLGLSIAQLSSSNVNQFTGSNWVGEGKSTELLGQAN